NPSTPPADTPPADTRPPPSAAPAPDPKALQTPVRQPTGDNWMASGEKTKARDIIAAIRTLKSIERDQRPATNEEKATLACFSGFGPVALSIFPDPSTSKY